MGKVTHPPFTVVCIYLHVMVPKNLDNMKNTKWPVATLPKTLGALRLGSLLALGFGEAPLGHVGPKDVLVKPCRMQSVGSSLIFKPVVRGTRRVPTSSLTT